MPICLPLPFEGFPFPWKHLKAEIDGKILAHISRETMDFAAVPTTSSGHGRSEQLGQDTDPGWAVFARELSGSTWLVFEEP